MSFPRYPKYKPSGVEWLGDVPEGWEVKRLKHNVRLLTEKTDRRDHPVALENIEGWSGRLIPTETAFEGEGIAFEPGDILFGKLRPYLAKAYLAKSAGEAVGDFHVLRPATAVDSRFTQYQILNREFISIVDGSTFGAKMPRASWEFVGGMKVTLPPLPEQTAIAEFLDRETGKIDELVAEQRRLMELLKEKRQAVISHAVTGKGEIRRLKDENGNSTFILQPSSLPQKPSGIEWLGDVPEHWEVMSVRRCANRIQTGGTPPTADQSYYEDGTVPWFGPGSFDENITVSEPIKWLNKSAVREGVARVFAAGSTMIVTIGATIGKVSSLVDEGSCNQQITVIEFDQRRVCSLFATYQIKRLEPALRAIAPSATLPIVGLGEIADIDMVIPALSEQVTIVAYLNTELAKFDTLTAEAQRAIDLLQERRTALISAAVTGQIDVRTRIARGPATE